MSTPLAETVVAHGRRTAAFFAPDGVAGDWQLFQVTFPTPFPSDAVRVVATAASDGVDAGLGTIAAVPVIVGANRNGFTIAARNSDCASGSAGMHWIAVLERPGTPAPQKVDVRTVVLPSRFAAADCLSGDWNSWGYHFANPLPGLPSVVASTVRNPGDTQVDVLVFGAFVSGTSVLQRIPTLVGVTASATAADLALNARNGGGWPGRASMNAVAVATGGTPATSMFVDSGVTNVVAILPTGGTASVDIEVNFAVPFATPPVVLVTACDAGLAPGASAPAVVGTAASITTHGFTLQAMNTDVASGAAAFYWQAFGCGLHCGGGTRPGTTTPVGPPLNPVGPIGTTGSGVRAS